MTIRILRGDCRDVLPTLPDESVNCVVTSPPYFCLRSYLPDGHPDKAREIGAEPTLADYIETLTAVFRGVRRVLRSDGTLWLNIGDSYAGGQGGRGDGGRQFHIDGGGGPASQKHDGRRIPRDSGGCKPKDLMLVPARLALALQADGWWLRSDVIWHKTAPMPESVTDRPTQAHEHVFLLTKSRRYFFNADAVREPLVTESNYREKAAEAWGSQAQTTPMGQGAREWNNPAGRNIRNVWTLGPDPFSDAHFATFPKELARRCILSGCPEGGTVLDPFGGSGTTGLVADRLNREAILIELNPEYARMSERRIRDDAPMFADVEVPA